MTCYPVMNNFTKVSIVMRYIVVCQPQNNPSPSYCQWPCCPLIQHGQQRRISGHACKLPLWDSGSNIYGWMPDRSLASLFWVIRILYCSFSGRHRDIVVNGPISIQLVPGWVNREIQSLPCRALLWECKWAFIMAFGPFLFPTKFHML